MSVVEGGQQMNATTQVSTPQRHGTGWFVPSGQVGYFVEWLRDPKRWRCTCPSHRWRKQGPCKHINAVVRMRQEVSMQG
jgi:hypothetical protein